MRWQCHARAGQPWPRGTAHLQAARDGHDDVLVVQPEHKLVEDADDDGPQPLAVHAAGLADGRGLGLRRLGGDQGLHAYGPARIWACTHMGLHKCGPACIWACMHMGQHAYGPARIWACTHMGLHAYGPARIWAYMHMGLHAYGPARIWACTHMGLHAYGPARI